MKDILEYWPFEFEPREIQKTALQWLQEQDAKYLLLEAPVGAGKSAIGLCYSAWLRNHIWDEIEDMSDPDLPPIPEEEVFQGSSFILTPQRMLQEQYEASVRGNDKINMASLYGRSNYSCNPHATTCDIGKEIKPKCPECPCNKARERAKRSREVVLNYALALNSFAFTDSFTRRKLMVLDECHNVEELLVSFGTLSITDGRCDKYNLPFAVQDDIKKAYAWTNDVYIPKLGVVVMDMREQYEILKESYDIDNKDKKFIKDYLALAKHYGYAKKLLGMDYDEFRQEFVYTKDKKTFEFKRLYGRVPFSEILDPMADKFLFMSSTILDKKGFCDDLGLDPNNTEFLSLQSEFPIKSRKVMYMPQTKMNAKWKDAKNAGGRQRMIDTIDAICDMNNDHSGIIHTANFQIAQWLVDELNVTQRIFHHNPGKNRVDRNTVINNFQDCSEPSILISPSSTEGLDLKDDLGRFAIFCKVPFGFLGDEWIRSRMNISGDWYKRQALIDVIQGGGRVVRSETDWGTVFILDESWAYLFRTTKFMIPRWWKSAYFDKS